MDGADAEGDGVQSRGARVVCEVTGEERGRRGVDEGGGKHDLQPADAPALVRARRFPRWGLCPSVENR
eukprot:3738803-Rhodomonas_salina.1